MPAFRWNAGSRQQGAEGETRSCGLELQGGFKAQHHPKRLITKVRDDFVKRVKAMTTRVNREAQRMKDVASRKYDNDVYGQTGQFQYFFSPPGGLPALSFSWMGKFHLHMRVVLTGVRGDPLAPLRNGMHLW